MHRLAKAVVVLQLQLVLGELLAVYVLDLKVPGKSPVLAVSMLSAMTLGDHPFSGDRKVDLRHSGTGKTAITGKICIQSLFWVQDPIVVNDRRVLAKPEP